MNRMIRRGHVSLMVTFLLLFIFAYAGLEATVLEENDNAADPALLRMTDPNVRAVMAVQNRHAGELMANPGIVGTATGVNGHGRPAVFVFAESYEAMKGAHIPDFMEGVPVVVKITGTITALKPPAGKGPNKVAVDPTARFTRPVPTGVSTGHPDITAGTIGARLTDGTSVYALSNNHVYADENRATLGDNVLQPGRYDGGTDPGDAIGTLYDYEPILFGSCNLLSDANLIDAAIARSSTTALGNSTPEDGYGTPKAAIIPFYDISINQRVMKYGRTTSLTKGRISYINAIVEVTYDQGVACFANQLIIEPGTFSAPGDSGSLIVSAQKGQDYRKPLGLLFAGSAYITVASPIDFVLGAIPGIGFDYVTIDGE